MANFKTRDQALESENPYIAFHCVFDTMKKGVELWSSIIISKTESSCFWVASVYFCEIQFSMANLTYFAFFFAVWTRISPLQQKHGLFWTCLNSERSLRPWKRSIRIIGASNWGCYCHEHVRIMNSLNEIPSWSSILPV